MTFYDEWDEAKWHFTYGDENQPENMVLQGGLVIVLYLVKSYERANRAALAAAMERLQKVMGQALRWGYWEHPRRKVAYTQPHFAAFVEWLRGRPITHAAEFTWSSGAGYDFVGSYGMRAFSQMNLKEEAWKTLSYLQVYLPVEVLRGEGLQAFEALIIELASSLPVLHGNAGLAFQQCNEYHRYENLELELAEQFWGFDVGHTWGGPDLREGIKTVNWYTILDSSWLEELGGRLGLTQAVAREAEHGLSLLDYRGGVIVKAGQWPSLGWVEREPQPAAYVAANRILKPVRAPVLNSLHMGSILGEVRFNKESTNQWLRRFDAPGIWPPRVNTAPPTPVAEIVSPEPVPVVALPSSQTLKAQAGERCPRSGDWYAPFLKRTVRMTAGEPMPGPEITQQGGVFWYLEING